MSATVTPIRPGLFQIGGNQRTYEEEIGADFNPLLYKGRNSGGKLKQIDEQERVKLAESMAENEGISEKYIEYFKNDLSLLLKKYRLMSLPLRPIREYVRGDDVVEYIQSEDGLGPWLAEGVLDRPMIRDLSASAYLGLANFLRRNELPDHLTIPKKSETVQSEEITPEAIKAARRLLSRVNRLARAERQR